MFSTQWENFPMNWLIFEYIILWNNAFEPDNGGFYCRKIFICFIIFVTYLMKWQSYVFILIASNKELALTTLFLLFFFSVICIGNFCYVSTLLWSCKFILYWWKLDFPFCCLSDDNIVMEPFWETIQPQINFITNEGIFFFVRCLLRTTNSELLLKD